MQATAHPQTPRGTAVLVAVAPLVNTRNPSAYCVESPALPDAVESDESDR